MEGGSGGSRAGSETSSDSIGKSEYEGNEGIHSWCSGARKKKQDNGEMSSLNGSLSQQNALHDTEDGRRRGF